MKKEKIEYLVKGYEQKGLTPRQIKNRLAKEEQKELEARNQKAIKSMTINVEWKKSSMYGLCPKASARVEYVDGTTGCSEEYKASGCGYCKESTVVSNIFNEVLKYKLYELQDKKDNGEKIQLPYGISLNNISNYFDYGIGMSSYFNIVKFLGGNIKHIADGKTFDVYEIIFE